MKNNPLLYCLSMILILSNSVFANIQFKSSLNINNFELVKNNNMLCLKMNIHSKVDADYKFIIQAPALMMPVKEKLLKDSIFNVKIDNNFQKEWFFNIPSDGHYAIEVIINIIPMKKEADFQYLYVKTIYFKIKEKKIVRYDYSPFQDYYKKPEITMGEAKLVKLKKSNNKNIHVQSQLIYVTIYGKMTYYDASYYPSQFYQGIPGIHVYLDWDSDDNPQTAWTPYSWEDNNDDYRYAGWDETDMDGNFIFYFAFYSDIPANQISDEIRIYASSWNKYCAYYTNTYPYLPSNDPDELKIDISQSTYDITAENLDLNDNDIDFSAAIRNIYRAGIYNKNVFNEELFPVYYEIRDGDEGAWYCPGGDNCPYGREIVFRNMFPDASTTYHEYGHYSADIVDGLITNCGGCSSHWFRKETNTCCAFNEGWAEFYSAACLDYWYAEENIDWIEETGGENETCKSQNWNFYQFLDYAQGYLCDNYDNTKVEGANACFFYSLLDNYDLRHNNYSGDNDDITMLGPAYIRNNLDYAITYSWYYDIPYIQGFRDVIIQQLDNYQINEKTASINALYNSIINQQGHPRPATPTKIEIIGDINNRFINWNDNTCPNSVSFDNHSGYPYYFDLLENNEDGFHVYRKPMSEQEQWNGTLNYYQLIHTSNQDETEYFDEDILQPGRYSYIAVAFNEGGNSIPNAQVIYDCSYSGQVYDLTLSNHIADSYEFYGAQHNIVNNDGTNFEIQTDADVTFCAGNEIRLGSGFKAVNGSDFHAKIYSCDGCVKVSGSPSPIIFTNEEIEKNNICNNLNYYLSHNIPNPFSNTTEINYSLPKPSPVSIEVYNSIGLKVYELVNKPMQNTGEYKVTFNSGNLPNGIYFYTMRTPEYIETKKMILMR
jgi:hypothetical protein